MPEWRVSKESAGVRLVQFLKQMCPGAPSLKQLKSAIETKQCTLNCHLHLFSSTPLREGDIVALTPHALDLKPPPQSSILYEDAALLILNKSPFVVCDEKGIKASLPHPQTPLFLVHRLDKETSGVLIVAKTGAIKEAMLALFKQRQIRKLYLAIVDGKVAKEEGSCETYLSKKGGYAGQTLYGSGAKAKGVKAVTLWRCMKRGKGASLLSCEPHTGRTHQLRVHLSEMGHPILGDCQYAPSFRCPLTPERTLLHAYQVSFSHPLTHKEMKITAPIPADFKQAMKALHLV